MLTCFTLASIDLFHSYILFSQHKSCDNTLGGLVLYFAHYKECMQACICLHALFSNEQKKGPNLLSTTTCSVLGKQNIQAAKVYYQNCDEKKLQALKIVLWLTNKLKYPKFYVTQKLKLRECNMEIPYCTL